jgi:hypothetical protein
MRFPIVQGALVFSIGTMPLAPEAQHADLDRGYPASVRAERFKKCRNLSPQ